MTDILAKLIKLNRDGHIADIDLEFCRLLSRLNTEEPGEVILAAVLTSHSFRNGHVCISLDQYTGTKVFEDSGTDLKAPDLDNWVQCLKKSRLAGEPGTYHPLILDDANRLYLHKLWQYEQSLAENILRRVAQEETGLNLDLLRNGMNRLFDETVEQTEVDWQKVAAVSALKNYFTVISGGPGTGKTTTVVKIIALLLEQGLAEGEKLSIALAAPTGKAAARLEESVTGSIDDLAVKQEIREGIPLKANTLHQLLGASRHRTGFRFNNENPLPYDVVIVDEASMVDQAMMSKLMEALLKDTRLILIGDRDQLASVEAGSVLGSICNFDHNMISHKFGDLLKRISITIPEQYLESDMPRLRDQIILLQKSYRFRKDSGIPQLSELVNEGEASQAIELLDDDEFGDVNMIAVEDSQKLQQLLEQTVSSYYEPLVKAASPEAMLEVFNTFRLLSPHRKGPLGVEDLNNRIEKLLISKGLVSPYASWYHGRPVIINQNDYSLGLNNGDIGICYKTEMNETMVCFQQQNAFKSISPSRIPDHSTAFCLTVHKSQGSEFDQVLVMLPNRPSQILTRELLYTAISRARSTVTLAGSKNILTHGIQRKLMRSSGLKDLLWKEQ